jgi:hypothetical protein
MSVEQSPDRVEDFKNEIAGMKIRTPEAEQERWALIGGIVAMGAGLLAIVIGWFGASGTTVITEAVSYVISGGILGLAFIIIGAALFVRYSSTRYLRYWLVRMIYEEQANADRMVQAAAEVRAAIEQSRAGSKAAGKPASSTITPSGPAG